MRKLFLEGSPKKGKSSMIFRIVKDKLEFASGFFTVRLLDNEGKAIGYKIVKASKYSKVEETFNENDSGIFLRLDKEDQFSSKVFSELGRQYLEETQNTHFFLIDEIGGGELTDRDYREKLFDIILGNNFCIGVIKSRKNSGIFAKNLKQGSEYKNQYENLRAVINSCDDAEIYNLDFGSTERAEAMIYEWKRAMQKEYENVGAL